MNCTCSNNYYCYFPGVASHQSVSWHSNLSAGDENASPRWHRDLLYDSRRTQWPTTHKCQYTWAYVLGLNDHCRCCYCCADTMTWHPTIDHWYCQRDGDSRPAVEVERAVSVTSLTRRNGAPGAKRRGTFATGYQMMTSRHESTVQYIELRIFYRIHHSNENLPRSTCTYNRQGCVRVLGHLCER